MATNAFVDTANGETNGPQPVEFDVNRDIVAATQAEMLANLAAVKAAILKEPEVLAKFVPLSVQMQMLDVVQVIIDNYPEKYFPGSRGYVGEKVQLACLNKVKRAVEKQYRWLEFISPRVQAQMITTIERCIRESPECIQYLPVEIQLEHSHTIGNVIMQNPQNFVYVDKSVLNRLTIYLAKAAALHQSFYTTLSRQIRDSRKQLFKAVYEQYKSYKHTSQNDA